MQIDIGNIVSVVIGALLVVSGQWFLSRQNAKTEYREAVRKFREERARPVFEALDRVSRRWDYESYLELADLVRFEGEEINKDSDEYKRQRKERRKRTFEQAQDDISTADTIADEGVRKLVKKVLWANLDPNLVRDQSAPTLHDAYLQLEKWVFKP